MKKKILLILSMIAVLACLFAISVFADNNIIKLDTLPTLEQIHANREAYVSHLDAFDGNAYGEIDSQSVVVLSDLQDPPTYYVYPSYYYIQSTQNHVYYQLPILNAAIAEADPDAFADFKAVDNSYCGGSCNYLIRFEVPTYVTTIGARAKFQASQNLVEVYFPVKTVIDEETGLEKTVTYITSVSGQNLVGECPKLEYMHNMEYLPAGIVQGNEAGFSGCYSLKEIKIPYGVTYIANYCFKYCYAVKEVVLPNSVTGMGKAAFSYCTSLESFTFSANFVNFGSVNRDFETFSGSNNLKFIYMPANVLGTLEAKQTYYLSIFDMSSKVVYFFTGDNDKAIEVQEWFRVTNSNNNIVRADIVAYDQSIDYVALQETLTRSVIVYGYSACEAFYNGVHDVDEEYSIVYTGDALVSSAVKSKACANCSYKVDKTDLVPLFRSLGYSVNENDGAIVQGFYIERTVLAEYEEVLGTINYGVIAAADLRDDTTEGFDVFSIVQKVYWDLSTSPKDYFDIKIIGITKEQEEQQLFLCAYIKFGTACFYISDGVSANVATSTSYAKQQEK